MHHFVHFWNPMKEQFKVWSVTSEASGDTAASAGVMYGELRCSGLFSALTSKRCITVYYSQAENHEKPLYFYFLFHPIYSQHVWLLLEETVCVGPVSCRKTDLRTGVVVGSVILLNLGTDAQGHITSASTFFTLITHTHGHACTHTHRDRCNRV